MKKKTIIAAVIVLAIGIAVVPALIYNRDKQDDTTKETVETSAVKVPEMSFYYGKENVCVVKGYTMDMDRKRIRDSIVPVSSKRRVPVEIEKNKNKIKNISYEITGKEEDSLIDSGEIASWDEKGDKLSFSYTVSAIMKPGTEYFLKFYIKTDKNEEINYYTRVMVEDSDFVAAQIDFAKKFSESTFNSAGEVKIAEYLEPDAELLNDSLGQVTLNSSYSMVKWNLLNPKKEGDVGITAKEFCIKDTGEAGTYTMDYQIKAVNAQNIEETYNVYETITVWTCAGRQYVLAYDREVNQVWKADKNNIGNSFIDFGIQNMSEIKHVESENGQYIAYEINGDVYLMDVLKKEITPIYKMGAESSKTLSETKVRVIGVDDAGNTDYVIYGYSTTKTHAGKNGIFIMEYSKSENVSVEAAFIPCTVPAEILETQLSELCYIGDGTLYIMLEKTVYYVNLKTKEWGVLAANLEPGSYAVNEPGTIIAYNTDGSSGGSESITIVDFTTGRKDVIQPEAGNKITVCGYTGTNLVYGEGNDTDSRYDFFPIEKLEIVDAKLEKIKTYKQKNIYISSVEITDTIINMQRWKNGKQIAEDHLLDNTEAKKVTAASSYYIDDKKQKELALSFTNNLDSSIDLVVKKKGKVTFDNKAEVNSKFEKSENANYYVYGYGKLQKICENKNTAIKIARDVCGLITDEAGQKIWTFEENYN